jgi:hypothetical protein
MAGIALIIAVVALVLAVQTQSELKKMKKDK